MLQCADYERVIARIVNDPRGVAGNDRRELEAHLASCVSCRAALADQRAVADALSMRPSAALPDRFQARLAARLDEDESWLPVVNWRAWTISLAPVAAAMLFLAWLMPGANTSSGNTATPPIAQSAPPSLETWTASNVPSAAAAFLQPETTGDSLLEAVLTNSPPAAGAGSDVR